MGEADATSIGANLAFAHGVSTGIAMIQQELAIIDQAVAQSVAMIDMVMQLGARMSEMGPDAASIAAPTGAGMSLPAQIAASQFQTTFSNSGNEAQLKHPIEHRPDQPTRHGRPSAKHTSRTHHPGTVAAATSTERHSANDTATGDAAPDEKSVSLPDERSVAPTPGASAIVNTQPPAFVGAQPLASSPPAAPLQLDVANFSPTIVQPSAPTVRFDVSLAQVAGSTPLETAVNQDEVLPANPVEPALAEQHKARSARHARRSPHHHALRRKITGSVAPVARCAEPTAASVVATTSSRRDAAPYAFLAMPTFSDDAIDAGEASTMPRAAQGAASDSEPRQGVLILDGAQLGRWIIDHLATSASLPMSGISGIDPRMSAVYPGAPSGA